MNGKVTASGLAPAAERAVGAALGRAAAILAIIGGVSLSAIALLTVVSILGRSMTSIGFGPVPGDFEILEAGTAFAISAFLPWAQLRRAHVTVDVFVSRFGPRALAMLSLIANLLMTVAAAVIAWRLWLGMADKLRYGETTFILQFPAWWGYAAAMVGAAFFAVCALFTVWRSLNEALGDGEPTGAGPSSLGHGE